MAARLLWRSSETEVVARWNAAAAAARDERPLKWGASLRLQQLYYSMTLQHVTCRWLVATKLLFKQPRGGTINALSACIICFCLSAYRAACIPTMSGNTWSTSEASPLPYFAHRGLIFWRFCVTARLHRVVIHTLAIYRWPTCVKIDIHRIKNKHFLYCRQQEGEVIHIKISFYKFKWI